MIRVFACLALLTLATACGRWEGDVYAFSPGANCSAENELSHIELASCKRKAELDDALRCDCGARSRYDAAISAAESYELAGYGAQYLMHLSMAAIASHDQGDDERALRLLEEVAARLSRYDAWLGKIDLMIDNSLLAAEIYESRGDESHAREHSCFALYLVKSGHSLISSTHETQQLADKGVTEDACADQLTRFSSFVEGT